MRDKLFAEDLNFWQTGRGSPDEWIDRARRQIQALGGLVTAEAYGEDASGRRAYILAFKIGDDAFRMIWPLVGSRSRNVVAEKRQAATMLYHAIEARCLEAIIRGPRVAFAADLVLADGRTFGMLTGAEVENATPRLLLAPASGREESDNGD